jgi:DNA-binding IclR family transcriptional regulator
MSRNGRFDNQRPRPPLLTPPEFDVYTALDDLSRELGYAPTYAQILERLGWSPNSKGSLHRYIQQLRRHGLVSDRGRGLRVEQ